MNTIFRDVEAYRGLIAEDVARERKLNHGRTVAAHFFSELRSGAADLLFGLASRVQPKEAKRVSYFFDEPA